jgi:hypothetical protein
MPEKGQSPYPDMPDIHIGEDGVLKLLNNNNSHGLFLEIFDGTRSVMITDIVFLKSFHMSFTDVYCVLMIFSVASCTNKTKDWAS